jgi:hypothetical protein
MMSEIGSNLTKLSRQSLWIRHSDDVPVVLCVEPWANEIQISRGNDYQVVFEGPEGEFPGVEWSKNRITLYGWSGSVAQVLLEGTVVLSCSPRVPEMPQRQS